MTSFRSFSRPELTNQIEVWDPISKQPSFKAGAVKIERFPDDFGEVKIHVKENQSSTIQQVASSKPNASQRQSREEESQHTRRLELVLAAFMEGVHRLVEICNQLTNKVINETELHSGFRIMQRLAKSVEDRMEPFVRKYQTDETVEQSIPTLHNTLFSERDPPEEKHGTLFLLHRFYTYLCHIIGELIMLSPVSQALWDEPFNEAVIFAQHQIERMQAWAKMQLKTKAPQRLLVPAYYVK